MPHGNPNARSIFHDETASDNCPGGQASGEHSRLRQPGGLGARPCGVMIRPVQEEANQHDDGG
jgi:hypothetical protein